ncbi:MAG TPA: hypothetical protein VHM70_00125 [Polyangiaceae bacterium]|nr:hypothetical protein [Polyangiaceae bacterium]
MLQEVAKWKFKSQASALWIIPPAHLNAADSIVAAQHFGDLFARSGASVLIIDIRGLCAYDAESRRVWQEELRSHHDELRGMVFIARNPVFRMVGSAVGLYTGVPTTVAGDELSATNVAARYAAHRAAS